MQAPEPSELTQARASSLRSLFSPVRQASLSPHSLSPLFLLTPSHLLGGHTSLPLPCQEGRRIGVAEPEVIPSQGPGCFPESSIWGPGGAFLRTKGHLKSNPRPLASEQFITPQPFRATVQTPSEPGRNWSVIRRGRGSVPQRLSGRVQNSDSLNCGPGFSAHL